MGGVKNPFGGGNIGTLDQVKKGATVAGLGSIVKAGGLPAVGADIASQGAISKGIGGIDTSISDPAGMNQYTDLANQAQQEYGNQRAFMDANINPAKKNLITDLAARASGKGPSIADEQLKSAFDKSLQQQLSLARSSRGVNPGLASRNAANIGAQQQQNIAGQAVVARMAEQNQAQDALQGAIANEQSYATGTLGSALGSQANVAAMQNAQRDRNDKRNAGLLGGVIQGVGSIIGLNQGGMLPRYANGGMISKPNNKMLKNQKYADGGIASKSQDMTTFASALKSKQANKPKKLAQGGRYSPQAYQAYTGEDAVSQFVKGAQNSPVPKLGGGSGGLTGGFKAFMEKKQENDDNNALDSMVDDFDAEDADTAQQGIGTAEKIKKLLPLMAMAADGGSTDDILETVKIAAKKLKDGKYAQLEKETAYTPHSSMGHKQVQKRLVAGLKQDDDKYNQGGFYNPDKKFTPGEKLLNKLSDAELSIKNDKREKTDNKGERELLQRDIEIMNGDRVPREQYDDVPISIKKEVPDEKKTLIKKPEERIFGPKMSEASAKFQLGFPQYENKAGGGNVPGKPVVNGDDERNDTFHAMLSPGEVVIPRTIVQEGPIAAAYFTKKASEQNGYNAENYKAERKSFGSMLKEVKDSERTYNKVKQIAKKRV